LTDPLADAIRCARSRWHIERQCALGDRPAEGFPPPTGREPVSREVGTEKGVYSQGVKVPVPTFPPFPPRKEKGRGSNVLDAHVSAWFEWAERAAILEYGGGWTRPEAERLATLEPLA